MKKGIGGIHRLDQNTLTSHIKLAGRKLMFYTPVLIGRPFSFYFYFSSEDDRKIESAGP
jgi:hypothetical protein